MSRYKASLAVKVEEEERRKLQDTSLKEQFEEEKGQVVYVESWPEKLFRIVLLILSIALALVGVIALVLPDTRTLIIEVFLRFVGETVGAVKIG